MLKNWRNALVGGLTVLATAVAAWEGAMGLAEVSWGAPWVAARAVQAQSLPFWRALKAEGDRRLVAMQGQVDAATPPLAALGDRPEVAFVAAWWPDSGRAEVRWRLADGRSSWLRLQGPPGQAPWSTQRMPSQGLPQGRPRGLGHWEDWASGWAWPGWKQEAAQGLGVQDRLLLARVATSLRLAAAEQQLGHDRAPNPAFTRALVARHAPGPVVVANLGPAGPLPAEDAAFYQGLLLRHGLNWSLYPTPVDLWSGLPLAVQASASRRELATGLVPLPVLPPKDLAGPGGSAWPEMGFHLTPAGHSEGWGDTWRHRGLPSLLAFLFALGGALAWSRGANAGRAFLPAMELAACLVVGLPAAFFTLQMGSQLALHWQVPESLSKPYGVHGTTLVLGAPSAVVQSGLSPWLEAFTQPGALALLRVLLGLLAVAVLLHRGRRAWAKLVEAGAADFAASALAAGVAHELRTPLAAVRVDAELLAHDLAPAEQRPTVAKRLLGSVRRLEGRLEDVMAFARLQQQGRATTEPYQPQALAEEALAEAAPLLTEFGASAELVGQGPQGPWYGDPAALRRALVELLANAAKHGASPIQLELRPEGWAVRDRGPGVPKGQLRRIFLPFERGAATARGAGLGLALVRGTAQAHGGEAWAEAAEGGGLRVGLRVRPQG